MKKNAHKGCIRGFYRFSKSWYNKRSDKVEINFGMFHPDGGTTGEMTMEWINLGHSQPPAPRLKVFNDGWSALALFTDLIQKMGKIDNQNISEEQFSALLVKCGFKDLTDYEDPNKDNVEAQQDNVTITLPKYKAEKLGLIGDAGKITEEN